MFWLSRFERQHLSFETSEFRTIYPCFPPSLKNYGNKLQNYQTEKTTKDKILIIVQNLDVNDSVMEKNLSLNQIIK